MKKKRAAGEPQDKMGSLILLAVGASLFVPTFLSTGLRDILHSGIAANITIGGMAMGGLICITIGVTNLASTFTRARNLPKKEVMRLAEARKGLLTLSEIATALDIEPDLARRTLEALSRDGIATQRWEEARKNLWEFHDYMKLPISESIDLAKAKGGRLSLIDLVAAGHSDATARETLDTLSEKGLAQQDPLADTGTVIVTAQ